MKDAELYSGIVAPEKQAEYEAWLVDRYGSDMQKQIDRSREQMAGLSQADQTAMMEELRIIEQSLAQSMVDGLPPQATALDPMIERHRAWVGSTWGRDCGPEAYAGLADIYEHPDFRKRYETIAPGFADYLITAMKAWARRQS